jgi:hypothetical protein
MHFSAVSWPYPYMWSAERVLDALRDWANLVGEAPRIHEWCAASATALGVESRRSRLWEQQHPRWPSATTVVGYHGSWRGALIAAGLPADRPPLELSVNERVDTARRLHAAGISQAAIAAELALHPRTIRRYLRATSCGCGQGWVVKGTVCQACAQRRAVHRVSWTADEVTRAITDWAQLEAAPPSMADWKQGRNARGRWKSEYPRWPSAHAAARLFGSWNAALEAAGFTAKPAAFTSNDVIAALITDAQRLGRPPYVREWRHRPNHLPGAGAVIGHFGSWTEGLRAAGLRSPQEKDRWTQAATLRAARTDGARRGDRRGLTSGRAQRPAIPQPRSPQGCLGHGTRCCPRPGSRHSSAASRPPSSWHAAARR